MKGPRGALFYMGPRFWPFYVLLLENELILVYLVEKLHNMFV